MEETIKLRLVLGKDTRRSSYICLDMHLLQV